eukprot:5639443-Ditylum_brightwellii.AAC.1
MFKHLQSLPATVMIPLHIINKEEYVLSNTGDATVTAQQQRVMRQQGINNPKPQMAWIHEMKNQIKKWKIEGNVILM